MTHKWDSLWRVASVLMIVGSIYVGWASLLDGTIINPIVIHWDGSFTVVGKQPLHPGDELFLRLIVTKERDLPGEVCWSIVSMDTGQVYRFAPTKSFIPPGYYDTSVAVLTLPQTLQPGKYQARGHVEYEPNPFKRVTLKVSSVVFEVVPK